MWSVPAAFIWEIANRGAARLVFLAIVYLICLSVIQIPNPRKDGMSPPDVNVQCRVILILAAVASASAIISVDHSILHLSAYPMRTSVLVAWKMLITAVASCLVFSFFFMICNLITRVGFPFWGPILLVAAAATSIQGLVWFTEKTAWLPVVGPTYLCPSLTWYYYRLKSTDAIWPHPTVLDLIVVSVVVMTSYWIGVLGIARNRCGEPARLIGLEPLFREIDEFRIESKSRFRTATEAQSWYDWQIIGWKLPIIVIGSQLAWVVVWLFVDRNSQELIDGYFFGGMILSWIGFCGGSLVLQSKPFQLQYLKSQFLASKPISNKDWANSILIVLAKSVLIAWSLWVGGLLIAVTVQCLLGINLSVPSALHWWYWPATLVSFWALIGTMVTLSLCEKTKAVPPMIMSGIVILFFAFLACISVLPEQIVNFIWSSFGILGGAAIGFSTYATFLQAIKNHLVSIKTAIVCGACWTVIVGLCLFVLLSQKLVVLPFNVFFCGLTTLVVFPIAMGPLTLSWNRSNLNTSNEELAGLLKGGE